MVSSRRKEKTTANKGESPWLYSGAFFLPLLIAGAYLNMGQSSCGNGNTLTCQGKPVTHTFAASALATNGDDVILVTAGGATIWALGGNDTVCVITNQSDVTVYGGTGDDEIHAGGGGNVLVGEDGDDLLIGGAGNDTLKGGLGNDRLEGREGDDTLWDEDEDPGNLLLGGAGSDTAYLCGPELFGELESVCNNPSCPPVPRSITDPYLPEGRRRSDCSPSFVELSISDGTSIEVPIPDKTTLMVPVSDDIVGLEPQIERVTLLGDRSVLVDLFNLPLFSADWDDYSRVGTPFDPFFFNTIQVRYPHHRGDSSPYSVAVDAARDQLGLTGDTFVEYFGGAISARVYDLGECSFGVSWDEIAQGVRAEIEPLTEQIKGLHNLIEWVRMNEFYIRPILTKDGTDRIYVNVKLELKVDISCCNTAKAYLGLVLKPTTSNSLPLDLLVESYSVGVYDVNGLILRLADGWFIDLDGMLQDIAAQYIPDSLGQYFIDSLPVEIPSSVRARRLVMTSGGFEAILAEDTQDLQYQAFVNAGLGDLLCPSNHGPALQNPSNWWRNHGLP